jgi:hypothetical protein
MWDAHHLVGGSARAERRRYANVDPTVVPHAQRTDPARTSSGSRNTLTEVARLDAGHLRGSRCDTPSYNSRGTCAIALTWPAGSTTTSADTRTDGSVKVVRSSVMSATRTDVSPGRSGPSRHSEWLTRRRSSGWRPVGKRRRISRFALASGQVVPRPPGWDPQPRCDLELTQVRTRGRDWWTLEFEACGPPICSATYLRPPLYSCSPSRCPVAKPELRSPCPARSGCPHCQAPRTTARPKASLPPGPGA